MRMLLLYPLFIIILSKPLLSLSQAHDLAVRASIKPSLVTIAPSETVKFKIIRNSTVWKPTVLSSATVVENVIWYVNGIKGGNKAFGFIDVKGIYSAPNEVPSPREIHISGQISGVQNNTLFATVIIKSDAPFYESVYQYAEPSEESAHFGHPHGVAFDLDGNLVIADEELHHVVRFSRDGRFLGYLGEGPGATGGKFHRPRVILLDETDGDLYVSDQKETGQRVQVFSKTGELKNVFAPPGRNPGEFLRIHGMAFDDNGNLFIVDVDNARITKTTHGGEYITSWGKRGIYGNELNEPHGLIVDPNNDIFVSSYYGTIKKFSPNGNFLFSFAEADPPDGTVFIHSISGDIWGNVYSMVRVLGDQNKSGSNFNIEKYNNNGDFVCGISLSKRTHSENWAAVDKDGYIYVLYEGDETVGFEVFSPK